MDGTARKVKHRNDAKHPMDGTARPVAKRGTVEVIRILNPFNPREHERTELAWRSKRTIAQYFPQIEASELIISVNGMIIEPERQSQVYLSKGDNIVICPVPAGGGGKQILAVVAMIAVAVFAPGIALAMNGVGGLATAGAVAGTLSTTGMMVAAGITMAGGLLVNALFAPPKPTTSAGNVDSSYGVDGAKNTSLESIPVPVCYGKFRTAGNVLGLYTETDASDSQTLYMLISAGEGPIASLSDIEINENPIADYKDVEVQTRLGSTTQAPIPWFQNNVVPHNKNQKLTSDWFTMTTDSVVDKVRLDFVAPSGLCEMSIKDGKTGNYTVELEVEYRKVGDPIWSGLPLVTEIVGWKEATGNFAAGQLFDSASGRPYNVSEDGVIEYLDVKPSAWVDGSGQPITDKMQLEYLNSTTPVPVTDNNGVRLSARVPSYLTAISLTAAKRSAVRRSFYTGTLMPAHYEMRVRRKTPKTTKDNVIDDVYLSDVNEITLDTMTYPHTALVALKIRMTDQLSGVPNVTFMNGGRLIDVFGVPANGSKAQWYPEASSNPAWIVRDILTHRRYGAGMSDTRLDFQSFLEFARYCDAEELTFNGPVESEMNVWDATQLVLRTGHSQLVPSGTRYAVVTEKPASPVMMFSVANMIEGTYKETWLNLTDRANEIDVTFFDKTDKYKSRTVKVYDPAVLKSGVPQQSSAITLYGVVDYERAYKEAQLQLNLNRHILRTIEFGAPLEAIACQVGDLVYVQHDMTEWAVSGRTESGSTTSVLKLDRPVTMASGKTYKVMLHRDAVRRKQGVVTSIIGNSIFLTDFGANMSVKRLQNNGKDVRVTDTFVGGVVVEDATGLTAGAPYSLWDTDVIEEYGVVNRPGVHLEVTVQTPFTTAPGQFITWMFGESEKIKRPFRIKAIKGSHEYRRDLVAVEYKEEVYDFDRYGSNMPMEPPKEGPIGPARNLSVLEETYVDGEQIVSKVVASWAGPTIGIYGGADIYVSRNGTAEEKVSSLNNRTSTIIDAGRGDKVVVRVVAFDIFGKRSKYEEAPVATYTLAGKAPTLDVGQVTGVGFAWSGPDCKINWRYNAVNSSFEFGSEPNGADDGSLDPHFKDYEVRVYDAGRTRLRRIEYVTDSSYIYGFDRNHADGLTRRLSFEIRMRDKFNNLGKATVLDAYNPPPRILSAETAVSFESATIKYSHSDDPDYAGARIWLSSRAADLDVLTDEFVVYTGPDTSIALPGLMFARTYYYRIAALDALGMTDIIPTNTLQFTTSNLNVDAIAEGVLAPSKLLPALRDRIDLIDAPATVVGSVAQRILGATGSNNAAIVEERNARVEGDTALTSRLDAMAGRVGQAESAILNEASTRTTAIAAEATQRNEQMVSFDTTIRSYVQTYSYSKASADATTNAIYTTLRSEYNAGDTAARNAATSYVQNYAYTKAEANSAIATSVNQVSARLNNLGGVTLEQKFDAQASTNNGLSAQYTVKIDNGGRISGFGLASTPVNGVPSSEFIVLADRFAVVTGGGTEHPFVIGTVNGVTRTIISKALIGDASIENAMIGNAQVNTLQIAGNAVTVPVSAYSHDAISCGDHARTTVQSAFINASGVPIVISFGAFVNPAYRSGGSNDGGYYNDYSLWAVELWRNGTLLTTLDGGVTLAPVGYRIDQPIPEIGFKGLVAFSYQDNPGAGGVTYEVKVWMKQVPGVNPGSPGSARTRIISMIETRR